MYYDSELYGIAEHEDFERGAEDMERRARRLAAEKEALDDENMGEDLDLDDEDEDEDEDEDDGDFDDQDEDE